MKKECIAKLFFTLVIFIFLLSLISAVPEGTCAIVLKDQCTNDLTNGYIVMGLSAPTDAHGALPSSIPSNYNYVLCCGGKGSKICDGSNKIIGLSSSTNAHAEEPASTIYPSLDNVCYGDLSCVGGTDSCGTGVNLNYPISILSLSDVTNSHIFPSNFQSIKICCKGTLTYTCSLRSAYWGTSEAVKGAEEQIKVTGSGSECAGEEISLTVKKRGLLGIDTTVVDSLIPTHITFDSTGTASGTWDTSNTAIGDKYYFIATLTSDTSKTKQSNNDLTILDPAYCAEISNCGGYLDQNGCQNDAAMCNVAKDSQTDPGIICNGAGKNADCSCAWADPATPTTDPKCKPVWSPVQSTGCGNNIVETGEQCDLGSLNGQPGSGCSSTCTLVGTPGPCGAGLTLCSDGTCSLGNCLVTDTSFSPCNYNGVCDAGEGASCSDCNGQQDTCTAGFIANTASGINGPACCKIISDGVCTPGCESVDPDCVKTGGACSTSLDCSSGASCISGLCYIPTNTCTGVTCPTGSTCNSGICVDESGNPINTCTGVTCPTGSTCADSSGACVIGSGTSCTLDSNCANGEVCRDNKCVTDGGGITGTGAVCGNGKLEFGEQCDLGSLNGQPGSGCDLSCKFKVESSPCGEGLTLCSDGTCSLNCFATDKGLGDCSKGTNNPSTCCKTGLDYNKISLACCSSNSDGKCNPYCSYVDPDCSANIPPYEPGTCTISQTLTKDCNVDPVGYKTLTWTGLWSGTQSGENYQKCVTGGTVTVPCPAQVQLPFFDYLELIGSILIIALVYVGLVFKKKIFRKK